MVKWHLIVVVCACKISILNNTNTNEKKWEKIYWKNHPKNATLSPQLTKPCHFPLWHEM